MDLISIIVPIYNVEKYLKECVNSLINQTYENIEILLIDDGSTDNSGKIADELSMLDKRIKVFHRNNEGLSATRNFGIDNAKGKYISFIDSDDIISPDFISFLYNIIKKNNVKIASCSFIHYFDDGTTKNVMVKDINKNYSKIDGLIYLNVMGYFNASCCNKLFDATLFEDIKFPLGLTSEDLFVIYKLINKANGIYFCSEEKYFYRQRKGSITKNVKINYNVVDAAIEQISFYKDNSLVEVLPYAYQTLFFAYLGIYNTLLCRRQVEEKKKIYHELIKLKNKFSKRFISKARKIQIMLFYSNIHIYNFLFILFNYKRNLKVK